jgi:hypothetical protein
MPTVDFTLEDIKQLIDDRLDTKLDERFKAEREYTRAIVRQEVQTEIGTASDRIIDAVHQDFLDFWEDNLGPAFEELHHEFGDLKRDVRPMSHLVDQHSKDIMRLRAES